MADSQVTFIQVGEIAQPIKLVEISTNLYALAVSLVGPAGVTPYKAEDAPHVSGDYGLPGLVVRQDAAAALAGTDGDYSILGVDSLNRLRVHQGGFDPANDLQKVTPKSAIGSGGQLTADGTAHTGACTLMGLVGHATTGGTIAVSDATGAAGTALFTIYVPANTYFYMNLPGIAFSTGVFLDLTTLVGSMTAIVGPAVV